MHLIMCRNNTNVNLDFMYKTSDRIANTHHSDSSLVPKQRNVTVYLTGELASKFLFISNIRTF